MCANCSFLGGVKGAANPGGSIHASHPASLGSILEVPNSFSLDVAEIYYRRLLQKDGPSTCQAIKVEPRNSCLHYLETFLSG